MKKFLLFALFAVVSLTLSAQSEVTKFLGIPVDGSKSAMIEKLKTKGFTYDSKFDWLEGEFNGEDVYVIIKTNKNKVWRIALIDKQERDEGQIRIRFNNLVKQFDNNDNYAKPNLDSDIINVEDSNYVFNLFSDKDYTIPEDERIGTQIRAYHKQYQASYRQMNRPVNWKSQEEKTEYTEEEVTSAFIEVFSYITDSMMNNSVWFTISKGVSFDKYTITLFYDNERNHAQGDDL